MSFWRLLGELALFEWLFGSGRPDEVEETPSGRSYDYSRDDDYLDRVHSLENSIDELELQQSECDTLSDRYDELQERIDDLQDELDELDDYFDD